MKKTLIALAVAGVVAAPAAFAATANVDIGGKIGFAVTGVNGVTNDAMRLEDTNSTITIKGAEDLGGGLKAGFSLTYGFATENGATDIAGIASGDTLSGQQQYLTLGGSFGTVVLGTHDNLVKGIRNTVDLFKDQTGDSRALVNHGSIDGRASNVVAYVSPSFNGFDVAVARSMDETAGVKTDLDMITGSYKNGPLYVGLGYYNANDAIAVGTDTKGYRLGAGYTMGNVKLVALYQNIDNVSAADDDRKTWGLGAAYNMGAMTFKGQFYSVNDNGTNQDANMFSAGVDYALSKRTTAYAAYSKFKNDASATYGSTSGFGGSETIGVTAGQDPSRLSVGIAHTF